jgi:hypothetical protein
MAVSPPSTIRYVVSTPRPRPRRSPPSGQRKDPPAPAVPSGLYPATGCQYSPGVTISEYPTVDVTQAINKGGPVLDGASIEPLFWGDYWQSNNAIVSDIVQAIVDILGSPYLSELKQYGINSVSLGTPTIVMSPGPPSPTYDEGDVTSMVWGLIDDDKYPEDGNNLFMIFAPPYTSSDTPGAHTARPDTDYLEDIGDVLTFQGLHMARIAWVNFGSIDDITAVFSHELVEALVDPDVGWNRGWITDSSALGDENEIADACILQCGLAAGHRVSAYYSARLGKCVVPSEVMHRVLTLSASTAWVGRPLPLQRGSTAVDHHSRCYSGTYSWTLFAGLGRATITADASTFVNPLFEWVINDTSMSSGSSSLKANVMAGADPLSTLTSLPPEVATLTCNVTIMGNTLTIDNARQGQCNIDVRCTVKELDASLLCAGICVQEVSCTLTGQVRVMDERWQADHDRCQQLQKALGRKWLEQQAVPRVPDGDPPPSWDGRPIAGIDQAVAADVQYLAMLAQFVERDDPQLARELQHGSELALGVAGARGLADGAGATSRNEPG